MPPKANAAFVCAMEEPLEGSQRPYDAHRPLGGCAEGTTPWVKEVREPSPAAPGRLERLDDAYERHGTGNRCLRCEPRAGRREVLVTARRPAGDSAEAIRPLGEVCHPKADHIILGQENLNTPKLASL